MGDTREGEWMGLDRYLPWPLARAGGSRWVWQAVCRGGGGGGGERRGREWDGRNTPWWLNCACILLGDTREGDWLRLDPCIPWPGLVGLDAFGMLFGVGGGGGGGRRGRDWDARNTQSCQPLDSTNKYSALQKLVFSFKIRIFFNRPSFQIILFWDLIYVLMQRKCIGPH